MDCVAPAFQPARRRQECRRYGSWNARIPLLLLFLSLAIRGQAQQFGDFSYESSGTEVTVTRYTGPGGAVTIPESIQGQPVTSIGGRAFEFCTKVTSIVLPDSVTSIGNDAFSGCFGLTSIVIPNSVTSIGKGAFFNCTSLTSMEIPDSVTSIGDRVFAGCTSLTSIVIPDSVTRIGFIAFLACTNLTSITIPDSVTSIGEGAFELCTGLASATIGSSVTNIGAGAFEDCPSLTRMAIPDSVTSIGDWAFSGCTSLTAIAVDPANPSYSSPDGVLFSKSQTELILCPGGKAGDYTIPGSVTSVAYTAFSGCTGLTSIVIPEGVAAIGAYAFRDCTSLTGVYAGGNAPYVGEDVFDAASSVTVYYLPSTTGWGATCAERPTAPWTNPAILEGSMGTEDDAFGFTIAWAPDATVVVETSSALTNPAWSPVSTNVLTGGVSVFSDPEPTTQPARFYRLRSP